MKKILPVIILGTFLLFTFSIYAADSLTINGSTTVLPIAQKAAEDFMKKHPDVSISVRGTGSGDGIKALIDGSTDIANASRQMKSTEIEEAKKKGINAVEHIVALDAIAVVVNPANPVKGLTTAQLADIYLGKIASWSEIGGENKEIVVISRDSSSGTYEFFVEHVLKKQKPTPDALLQASNGAVAQTVAKNKYAIGYVGIGYVNKDLKALTIDGITASVETVHSGKYPIWRHLYMYTNGEPKGPIANFIKFVKGSEGQKIVQEEGFVSLK